MTEAADRKLKPTESRDAFSIREFCRRHNISVGTYYNLQRKGLGPRQSRVSAGRVIITVESAAEWRSNLPAVEIAS